MIDVTERAKKELQEILNNNVEHPDACLRLRVNDQGQLGLGIDVEMPEDRQKKDAHLPIRIWG